MFAEAYCNFRKTAKPYNRKTAITAITEKKRKGYDRNIITFSPIILLLPVKSVYGINPYGSTNCIRLEGIISASVSEAPF